MIFSDQKTIRVTPDIEVSVGFEFNSDANTGLVMAMARFQDKTALLEAEWTQGIMATVRHQERLLDWYSDPKYTVDKINECAPIVLDLSNDPW
jgi:hypothetical protein